MALWHWWKRYWFRPAPLIYLAACRIVFVAFQLLQLGLFDHRREFTRLSEIPDALYHPLPILRVLTFPFEWLSAGALNWQAWQFRPSYEFLEVTYWLTCTAGGLALIGLKTNLSLLVFAVGSIFLQAFLYSFHDFHHPEAVLMIALTALAFSPAGRVLSLDDLRRRLSLAARQQRFVNFNITRQRSAFARWPLLLIQWVFALLYFSAALSKLKESGFAWANGYTLQYYLLQDGLRWGSSVGVWLSDQHMLVLALSWLTLIFEGTFFLVLFFPALAWVYLPMGVGFHTGIYVAMRAPFFLYLPLYLAFIPWLPAWRRLNDYAGLGPNAKNPEILFDGQCPLCIRSMTIMRYFDWGNALSFSDLERHGSTVQIGKAEISLSDLQQDMHVRLPDGSVQKGFFAFREVLKYTPPLWWLLSAFYLPFAKTLGPRLYHFIASRRARMPACDFATCSTHSVKH